MTKEMELAKHLYIFKIIAYYTERDLQLSMNSR